ncbi:CAP domain-containing protein [Flavobacterium jejuense]|uniref:CAP domain-containing protein n=1 Tax=Flavobacterium jejuense TaxID=1544455 RepID=A0ABX0IMC2_9FLAO|nr:CAP domain-containing protein [Flavobacterium jejuense]NHN24863.1 CAP domain-containing protein [Flavobacterium jejuense]
MKYSLIFCLFLFSIRIAAQEINIDYNKLGNKVIELINQHRKTLRLQELKKDLILLKAARDHSNYMLENNILSHEQKNTDKKFPKDRIQFYEGKMFDTFGENILFTSIELKKYNEAEINILARKLFLQWKNSPPHYKNIIYQNYEFTDIAFSFDKKQKRLYATNVFGAKGFIIPNQLSENAFGLTEKNTLCKKINVSDQIHIGNGLRIEGNDVVLYYYDIEKFKRIFNERSDAIAIDFIEGNQFKCGSKNEFDVSAIYDGTLSKPIYKDELLANNQAENKLKLITKVGEIPEHLRGKDLTLSTVFIFTNCACAYSSPIEVDSRTLSLLSVKPILEIPKNTLLTNKGIIKTEEHSFAFGRNETIEKLDNTETYLNTSDFYDTSNFTIKVAFDTISNENESNIASEIKNRFSEYNNNLDTLTEADSISEEVTFEIINEKIHSSQIYSYSSVEGNEALNKNLYLERVKSIEKYGREQLNILIKPDKVVAEENWETCYIQLEMENFGALALKPKEEIRSYINTNRDQWEAYLNKQRVSKLIANYYGELKPKDPNDKYYLEFLYEINLRTGIYEKDYTRANLALAKIYEEDYSYAIFDEIVFNELMTNEKLVQNAAAVLIKSHRINQFKTVRFLKYWLTQFDTLTKNAQFNLLNLYCVTNDELLESWDVSTTKLANVTKPKTLMDKFEAFEKNLDLIANYNYVGLYYANHTNDYEMLNFYFSKVYTSFKNNIKTPKDRVNLGLFLNFWSSYSTTIELLKEQMKKPEFSKEEALLLAQTYPLEIDDNGSSDSDLEYILKKVYRLNKKAWCEWQNENKNVLRNTIIKREYCKMCTTDKK